MDTLLSTIGKLVEKNGLANRITNKIQSHLFPTEGLACTFYVNKITGPCSWPNSGNMCTYWCCTVNNGQCSSSGACGGGMCSTLVSGGCYC